MRLLPREEEFFDLFVAVATRNTVAAQHQRELFDAPPERRIAHVEAIKRLEHEADQVTHDIFAKLNRTFITPLEREDIHDLAAGLDDVLDAAEAIGTRLVLFKVARTTPEAAKLGGIIAASAVQIEKAVQHLRDHADLLPYTVEVNRLENEADAVSRQAVADLFSGRHEVLDVLRWREIYGRLEGAADKCEDVANTIEAIVLKNR